MHYALYRKYRPLTFADVVGQEHVTQTLKNQIKSGQFAHAYLFTGTRGTGKTSCARIFARAINCLSPEDGEPCNTCESCRGLLDGDLYDVYEIDAASNNSVENIRQIREEVAYPPVKTKYKVYIIDEVHMLSSGAFNALLKTLEEPPPHAVFLLATTEAHKLPATILSRCQRFDMHRLSPEAIASHLEKIIASEKRQMPADIVSLVASLADGSVRDGLSVLDKVLELDDPNEIRNVLGVCGKETLFALSDAVCRGDIDKLYAAVGEFYTSSRDFGILLHDLLSHFRNLLIAKTAGDPSRFLLEDCGRFVSAAGGFSVEHILFILSALQSAIQNLSRSADKRADTEVCLLRCANPSLDESVHALAARVKKLEEGTVPVKKVVKKVQTAPPPVAPQPEKEPEPAPRPQPEPEPEPEGAEYREFLSLDAVAANVKSKSRGLFLLLSHSCQAVYQGKSIIFLCSRGSDVDEINTPQNRRLIEDALAEDRKTGYSFRAEVGGKEKYLNTEQQKLSEKYNQIQDSDLFQF